VPRQWVVRCVAVDLSGVASHVGGWVCYRYPVRMREVVVVRAEKMNFIPLGCCEMPQL
jgi:hypothetical protein